MPVFNPSENKVAVAPIRVSPSGLDCEAEIFLGPDDMTKAATSGLIAFTSTGASQEIRLPITMPTPEGAYLVFIDIYAGGYLIAAYQATEDVIVTALSTPYSTIVTCPGCDSVTELIIYPDLPVTTGITSCPVCGCAIGGYCHEVRRITRGTVIGTPYDFERGFNWDTEKNGWYRPRMSAEEIYALESIVGQVWWPGRSEMFIPKESIPEWDPYIPTLEPTPEEVPLPPGAPTYHEVVCPTCGSLLEIAWQAITPVWTEIACPICSTIVETGYQIWFSRVLEAKEPPSNI